MAHGFVSPGGFIRSSSVKQLRSGPLSGRVREIQNSEINTSVTPNTVTLTVDDILNRQIEFDSAASLTALTTVTTPTPAQMIAGGLKIGDRFTFSIRNNKTAFGVTVAGGTGFTATGDPGLTIAQAGGYAECTMIIRTATTGDLNVKVLSVPTSLTTTISAARTLTSGDSGLTFAVSTDTYSITLPTPAPGLRFNFVVATDNAGVVSFVCGSAAFHGVVSVNDVGTAANNITTVAFAAAATVGDVLSFIGVSSTEYLVFGNADVAGAITVAA